MPTIKTPGVYIVENNNTPDTGTEVPTALAAFVGYTQKADNVGKSLAFTPWRIASLDEYRQYFGAGPTPRFAIVERPTGQADFQAPGPDGKPIAYGLEPVPGKAGGRFALYSALRLFFKNGGGPCVIVSVGHYDHDLDPTAFAKGLDTLGKTPEPTILVIPEAVLLAEEDCRALQQRMLAQCGTMGNRFAILDIWSGDKPRNDPNGDPIARFRAGIEIQALNCGAAYYPWLNADVVGWDEVGYDNIASTDLLQQLLRRERILPDAMFDLINRDRILRTIPWFEAIIEKVRNTLNRLPPAAAMAGIYAKFDQTRGVWKAPANVALLAVRSPTVALSSEEQEDLNVSASGKAINAIRTFVGEGTLVWGARTLDANSLDWRYIQVRRTAIMLEQTLKQTLKAYEFAPNTASTWIAIKTRLQNYLTDFWKRGGLAGATPDDAFGVHVGLGETMTAEDILEGNLRVTVLVALVHPAEFIEITMLQQMRKA
jgi:uncharacterized protein